jgi:hypothetical protein
MQENLELSIAMKEFVDNKFTMSSDHEIACRIIESMREGLRTATFANLGEKLQPAQILHSFKGNRDHGETINLDVHHSEVVGVFKREMQEEETTLQEAMLASSSRFEQLAQDVTVTA